MKPSKRRFTTIAKPTPTNEVPKLSNPFSIHTCKFCRKIIKPTEDSMRACQCQGISQKVHRHCLTTYILSLKSQLCLQAKCVACAFPYQYSVETKRKFHCCALNGHSKKLYCCLGVLALVSFWLALMCYCFANENSSCFTYTGIVWGTCAAVYIWAFFQAMCMEEVKLVFLQEYKPLVRSRSANELRNIPPEEEEKKQNIEEVRIEIEDLQKVNEEIQE